MKYRNLLLLIAFYIFSLALISYSQETEKTNEDETIDLPPVKIEIVDATQLVIPKEKFDGLTRADVDLYLTLNQKERLWYIPAISSPERIKEKTVNQEDDFLLMLSAYPGLPASLAYQMLLVKGFGNSQILLDLGRSSFLSERAGKLDKQKKMKGLTTDKLNGLLAFQAEKTNFRSGINYKAKDLNYLGVSGARYPNDRSLFSVSTGWDQKYIGDVESSLNTEISRMGLEGPLVSDSSKAIDIKTDFSLRTFISASTPIDTGLNFEHFIGDSKSEDFNETIVKLYVRDNRIKLYPFILGVGFELALDTKKSSISSKGRETSLYPNPYALLTSQIGSSLILQFGLERYILKQNLNDVYMEGDYTRFNPSLGPERAWHIDVSLKYNLMKQLNAKLGIFDKEISGLMVLRESKGLVGTDESGIVAWIPDTIKNAHITGINAGWELLLLKDHLKQRFDYIHEIQSEDEFILYRPKDKGIFTIEYSTPYEVNLSLSTEFYGTRYVNKAGKKLASYMLWKPKVSKSFNKNAEASLALEFYVGKENYQIWDGYKLPKTTIDLGATVRF